jgi:hypothetical protein
MDDLLKIGKDFVNAMRNRHGLDHINAAYAENAQSVEAVTPPYRDVRITKGRDAIKAKREDWLKLYELHKLDADGPYLHPPNQFAVRFEADVTQKATGRRMTVCEMAVYSVEDGKIDREEFFILPG